MEKSELVPKEIAELLRKKKKLLYFRWDLLADRIAFAEDPASFDYRFPSVMESASATLYIKDFVHDADKKKVLFYFSSIFRVKHHGKRSGRLVAGRFRFAAKDSGYLWSEVRMVTCFEGNQPRMAYGSIRDINNQRRYHENLKGKAERDGLTGFLNKTACREEMEGHLLALKGRDGNRKLAMILVDADGFKAINDNFGHPFGDGVLIDMADAIKRVFRSTDIMGRIGGDEFLILMKDVPDDTVLCGRCQKLVESLRRSYESGSKSLPFSVSVGIAEYPVHGKNYDELFTHADRALYNAKARGKAQYCIYETSLVDQIAVESTRDPAQMADIQERAFRDNMVDYIFRLFYETTNSEATIEMTLGMLGKQFDFDRIAVYRGQGALEYEWLGPRGISLNQKAHKVNISAWVEAHNKLVPSFYAATPHGVMSICENAHAYDARTAEFGLGSFVHCKITRGSEDIGYVGFESARVGRSFTREELQALGTFSVLLGNVLLPHAAGIEATHEVGHLHDILNCIRARICVVDVDTRELLYCNQVVKEQMTHSPALHEKCYSLLQDFKEPCGDCLLSQLSSSGKDYVSGMVRMRGRAVRCHMYRFHWSDTQERKLALAITELPK